MCQIICEKILENDDGFDERVIGRDG